MNKYMILFIGSSVLGFLNAGFGFTYFNNNKICVNGVKVNLLLLIIWTAVWFVTVWRRKKR
jgi:hypothetical protein